MAFTIRVAHSIYGAGNTPMSMAVAAGFFAERGLDVRMQEVPLTNLAVEMVVSGECEAAVAGSVPVLNAALAGGDPIIVMSIESENVFAIMGARHVRSPEDLRGAKIGIGGRGNNDSIVLHRALREWNIDPATEVEFVVLSSRGALWDALVAGEISAMTATIPQPILARSVGLPVLRDYAGDHEPFQAGAVVTTRRFAETHPDELTRFLEGQLEGVRLFQRDFDAALPHLMERSKLDDIEVLRETHRLFAEATDHYVPSLDALANVARGLEAATGRRVDIDLTRIVEPSFALALEDGRPTSRPRV